MLRLIKGKLEEIKLEIFYRKVGRRSIYFVISTGRTGTNFMETFLNSASDKVFCVHEPKPDLFDISIEKIRDMKSLNVILDKIKKARLAILKKFVAEGKTTFVESNPFAAFLIPEIKQIFPKAKFIFIYRDIYSYLLSALNKSPLASGINNFYAESDGRKRLCPSDFEEDEYKQEWHFLSRAQRISWYWNKCNEYLNRFARDNNTTVLELKFEALFAEDTDIKKATLISLFSFLDIDISQKNMDYLIARSFDKRNQTDEKFYKSLEALSKAELDWINNITNDLRGNLGYTKRLDNTIN